MHVEEHDVSGEDAQRSRAKYAVDDSVAFCGFVLNVRFEDLFVLLIWVFERLVLVSSKARMFWVRQQMLDCLVDLREKSFCLNKG